MSVRSISAEQIRGGIPPRIGETRKNPWLITLWLAVLSCVAVLYLFNPAQHAFYPTCMFYKTTGLLCPGCGTLRAMHQLLHGHLEAAFRFNALIVSALPLLAAACVQAARYKAINKPAMAWVRPGWLWALLVILIVFGILRNVPGAAHYYLAPL